MFDAGSIVAKITLDSSQLSVAANRAKENVKSIGDSMQRLGKDIINTTKQMQRMATTVGFIGAGITAPLILAFKSAEKYSASVRDEIEKFNNLMISLRVSIAESLLPVMHRFGNMLADLVNRWNALSPAIRDNILQTALIVGTYLVLGATISTIILKIVALIGYLIKFGGVFLTALGGLNLPLLAIAIAIGAIIFAMIKWEKVSNVVFNLIEFSLKQIAITFDTLGLAVLSFTDLFLRNFAFIIGVIEKVNPLLGGFLKGFREGIDDFRRGIDTKVVETFNKIKTNSQQASELMKRTITGQAGKLAENFNNARDAVAGLTTLLSDLGNQELDYKRWTEAPISFAKGWKDGLQDTVADLNNWGKTAGNIIQQTAQTMQSSLSNFFQGFLKGEIQSAKQLFAEFGNFVIKVISDVIAQWITAQIMTGIGKIGTSFLGGLGGGLSSGATINSSMFGGMAPVTSSFLGFQEGAEKIPYTGLFRLHEGEKVTPKYDTSKGEPLPLTIYNLITPEAVAIAMSSKEGEGVIINIVNTNSLRNGVIRRDVKRR